MKQTRFLPLTLVALAVLAGCNSLPADNARLNAARSDYLAAQADPSARDLAPVELKQAGDAVARAGDAWTRNDKTAEVDHLAYVATQRVAIARATGAQKAAELTVANAEAARDKLRLAARTTEVDVAKRTAVVAQIQADDSKRIADVSQTEAANAQARNLQLEAQLKDMNAKKTDRGMVVTIGDVLFDTDKAQLKSGGLRSVEKLVGFLKEFPQRKAMVEGFTDSTGSDAYNQELSGRRADAVRTALVDMGVDKGRVGTHGYGEAYPVAGNDNASGRQLNRRVEIVLSDDAGVITPR